MTAFTMKNAVKSHITQPLPDQLCERKNSEQAEE